MARILVMDDEHSIRTSLNRLLTQHGYEVVVSPDGRDGMKLFRKNPADLVITDLLMPHKSGFEVILELQEDFPDSMGRTSQTV